MRLVFALICARTLALPSTRGRSLEPEEAQKEAVAAARKHYEEELAYATTQPRSGLRRRRARRRRRAPTGQNVAIAGNSPHRHFWLHKGAGKTRRSGSRAEV
jgi:hypothetical protein